MLSDEAVGQLLSEARTVAVVPASSNPTLSSHRISAYLLSAGYDVIPIGEGQFQIGGRANVNRLADVVSPDIVYGFVTPSQAPALAREAVQIRARALWLNEGIVSDEATTIAASAGLQVVADRNMATEHRVLVCGEDRVYFMPM